MNVFKGLPKRLKVAHTFYDVETTAGWSYDAQSIGQVEHHEKKLLLRADHPMLKQANEVLNTFVHECFHIVCRQSNVTDNVGSDKEEEIVAEMSRVYCEMLLRNPDMNKYIYQLVNKARKEMDV